MFKKLDVVGKHGEQYYTKKLPDKSSSWENVNFVSKLAVEKSDKIVS